MRSRYAKILLPLAAAAAISVPAVAQARHGSDDPPSHVRHEHHRVADRHGRSDDDFGRHARHGNDDGRNHR